MSWEYEKKTEMNFLFYKNTEGKEKLIKAEGKFIENGVQKIVKLVTKVWGDSDKRFVVFNHKGNDPLSSDALVKEGAVTLHRAKRRNMERLTLVYTGVVFISLMT